MPFDPAGAVVVSEENNMMSHGSSFLVTPSGMAYLIYQRDSSQMVESGDILSIEMRMAIFPIDCWQDTTSYERVTIMRTGEPVGDYTMAGHCPSDPVLQILDGRIACVILGGEDGSNGYIVRYLDPDDNSLSDYVDRCRLSYKVDGEEKTVPLTHLGLSECYVDLGFGTPEKLDIPSMGKRFIEYDGYYYNLLSGWCSPQSRPLVIRTKDLVKYELVFACPEFEYGCVEGALQLFKNEFYIQARTSRAWDPCLRGTYIGKYSFGGECLVHPYCIGEIESRPELFVHDGKLYDICNVAPNVETENGSIYRSHIRVAELDDYAATVRAWDITHPYGLHYYCVGAYGEKMYVSFTEDVKLRKPNQCKGDIGFCEFSIPDVHDAPIDYSESRMVSEPDNLMTHCPSATVVRDGDAYVAYYRDNLQQVEDSQHLSIELKLLHFNIVRWPHSELERKTVMTSNTVVGDFFQGNRAPYDPVVVEQRDSLLICFEGYEKEDVIYAVRRMDLKTRRLGNSIERCTIQYQVGDSAQTVFMSKSGVQQLYSDLGLGEDLVNFYQPTLERVFVDYDGYAYSALSLWCCPQSRPIILRTKDYVHYDMVFCCREYEYGGTETSLVVADNRFYIIARSARPEDKTKAGTYLGVYSPEGECLVKPWKIGDNESRPAMLYKEGKVFAIYNVLPEVMTEDKGRVYRSHIRISEISPFGKPVRGWDFSSEYSFQYYTLCHYKDKVFIAFIEDRNKVANKSRKGNLSFCEIHL